MNWMVLAKLIHFAMLPLRGPGQAEPVRSQAIPVIAPVSALDLSQRVWDPGNVSSVLKVEIERPGSTGTLSLQANHSRVCGRRAWPQC